MTDRHPIPAAALAHHIAILGKTGSGKSNLAKCVVEELLAAGERIAVIDPTGTWWGLRLDKAGRKPSGLDIVIAGGAHADVPIADGHGAALAEAIGTSATPVIVDTRALTVSARTRLFTEFAEALLQSNRGPLTLVIDEAHLFAPQGRVNDPRSGVMVHAANNLVSLGRGIGLRIILISQRPAKLHKDSLTQVETLVAMRLIAPQDRRAIDDWIGEWAGPDEGRDLRASLVSLPRGDAWVWSPEIGHLERAHCPLASTYDSGSVRADEAPVLPAIDVSGLAGRLAAIASEAAANDPGRLKKRLAELETQLKRLETAPAADPKAAEAAWEKGFNAGYDQGHSDACDALSSEVAAGHRDVLVVLDAIADTIASMSGIVTDFGADKSGAKQKLPRRVATDIAPSSVVGKISAAPARQISSKSAAPSVDLEVNGELSPAKCRILVALRQLEALGQGAPDKVSVAWFAGASPRSSAFANNLGALRTAGLVDYPGPGSVALTDAGGAIVPPVGAPRHDDIMALCSGKLTPAMMRLLRVAVDAWPDPLLVEDLAVAAAASPTSSAFANNKGRLRSLGLITYPASGQVRAADLLFP